MSTSTYAQQPLGSINSRSDTCDSDEDIEHKILFPPAQLQPQIIPPREGMVSRGGRLLARGIRWIQRARARATAREILTSGLFNASYYRMAVPGLASQNDEFLAVHYLLTGAWHGLAPHPLFDSWFYLQNNPDVLQAGVNPLLHFLRHGGADLRNPHPVFDSRHYAKQPGAFKFHSNPVIDYLRHAPERRPDPHPLFSNSFYDSQRDFSLVRVESPLVDYLLRGAHCNRSPHPLFDNSFYLSQNSDVLTKGVHPLLHFLAFGTAERRNPHPLFDIEFYLAQFPDLEASKINPLVHYLSEGAACGARPHRLFDPGYYVRQIPPNEARPENLLSHFLTTGWKKGYSPCPYFDTKHYLAHCPDVVRERSNPLVHYVLFGDKEGRYTCNVFWPRYYRERYRDVAETSANKTSANKTSANKPRETALEHFLRLGSSQARETLPGYCPSFLETRKDPTLFLGPFQPALKLSQSSSRSGPIEATEPVSLFCVYGASHVQFLRNIAFPHYRREAASTPIDLHLVNYQGNNALFTPQDSCGNFRVFDWSSTRENSHIGFGAGHNFLFGRVQPSGEFVIVNPDSYPLPDCLSLLRATLRKTRAGIVEARQWPAEHPKEFHPATWATPWASGAFSMISSEAFRLVTGFDEGLFLYTEDVDLSWRMWLAGYAVISHREALCCHLTGHLTYRPDRFYFENFMCALNFLYMAKKYFGHSGGELGEKFFLQTSYPRKFKEDVLSRWNVLERQVPDLMHHQEHPAIMIYGFNLYHRLQKDVYPKYSALKRIALRRPDAQSGDSESINQDQILHPHVSESSTQSIGEVAV